MTMEMKNLMVFFLTIVSVLFLVTTVSAAEIADVYSVEVDGTDILSSDISVLAGETISVKVFFDALEDASDVKVKVELEGNKVDIDARTTAFDVEEDFSYKKTLNLKVPYELKDEVSDELTLVIKIWNGDHRTDFETELRVQRPSYNAAVMSISTAQRVDAGESLPVDVVIKNTGYNYLDDLYVTVKIPELGVQRTSYFGDLVSFECTDDDAADCDEDNEDTLKGRFYLEVPYDAISGIYNLEVEAKNSDTVNNVIQQIAIDNDFTSNVVVTSTRKTFAAGQDSEYQLLLVNPTNKLKVYRVVPESSSDLSTSVSESVVAVPSGASRTVSVIANARANGEYDFNVNVFSGEELVSSTTLTADVSGSSIANPVVVLTIILAIVFLVLLIVLIVLLGKKPEKTEEFGESYY
ncbi:hypothetical protein GOV13_04440 [Candidatus Pacearchaeota archaeon]|nr:hypothetical protein [Candidatus Pacearchaeota archaeon]